ncbi:MAG: hypothetical protein J6X86_00240 [Bacteroidales bacterium]|nr:hypothetical protein [Bacteroidales bacterium]
MGRMVIYILYVASRGDFVASVDKFFEIIVRPAGAKGVEEEVKKEVKLEVKKDK